MTIAEKLRKEMEERGAVKAVPQKTVIVNTSKQKKAAEKSAPSLLSQGQRVDIVRDTGAKTILPGAKMLWRHCWNSRERADRSETR